MSALRPTTDNTISLKSPRELDAMRVASEVVARTIEELRGAIDAGMTTRDLERIAKE